MLEPGHALGPYRIVEPLGAGGMGEVYAAQDTRLGRNVAVKVLPEAFASDPERLARFEQEARAAAALNHPHIAAVYDVGAAPAEGGGTTHFMVQEYLQGQSLRDLLERGTPGIKKALALGTEIAEALKAAHRAGIVHRDLKPENVFVSPDGHAKILDFGLAKLTEIATGPLSSQSMSPTVLGTQAGAIMGTAGYMAPEQVQGREVDARADVFALGCVLWEMLTGRRAFAGKSVPHTLHKILDEAPEGHDAEVGNALPLRLRWLLDRTLAKDPEQRAQSAGDVAAELRRIASEVESGTAIPGAGPVGAATAAEASAGRAGMAPATVAAIAVITLVLGASLAWMLVPSAPASVTAPPTRFFIDLPNDLTDFANRNQQVLAISPDGERIAFVGDERLWLRSIGDLEPVEMRGTLEPRAPSFSPDSTQIAFWADDQIKRIDVGGGAAVPVGPSPGRPQGLSWATDGFIYVGASDGKQIYRLPETGGQAEVVIDDAEESAQVYGPRLLPGGAWLMFTLALDRRWDAARIVAQPLQGGERRVLIEGGRDARYSPTGHLLYVSGGVLLTRRFDPATLTVTGGAVPLIEGIRTSAGNASGAAYFSVSDTGTIAYAGGGAEAATTTLGWVDRDGSVEPLPLEPGVHEVEMRLSPDGERLAAQLLEEGTSRVWLYRADRPGGQPLTSIDSQEPVWSPDGEWIYFAGRVEGGDADLWRRRADFGTGEELVQQLDGIQWPSSISTDGEWLYFTSSTAGEPPDLFRLNLREPGEPEPLLASPEVEMDPQVSPDGRFVAFSSFETGSEELFVLEIETGRRWRISPEGGGSLAWSPAGNELLWANARGVWSAEFTADPEFSPGVARVITPHPPGSAQTDLTLSPDGRRWLRRINPNADGDGPRRTRIDVVVNWFTELNERAPLER